MGLGRADSMLVLTSRPCYQAMLEEFFSKTRLPTKLNMYTPILMKRKLFLS